MKILIPHIVNPPTVITKMHIIIFLTDRLDVKFQTNSGVL